MENLYYIGLKTPIVPKSTCKLTTFGRIRLFKWGDDNNYPLFLNYLYNNCALHNGIVNGKVLRLSKMIQPIDETINKNGISKHTITEILAKCLFDYELKNAFAILVRKSKANNAVTYDYVDIDKVRINETGELFYYSENYSFKSTDNVTIYPNYFTNPNADEALAVYYANSLSYFDINSNTIIYMYYPTPIYVGAIEAMLTDIEISHYHYSEIINGFVSSAIINFSNGVPEEEEQRRIINQLRRDIADRDKKGGVIVTFSNGRETAPEITMLNGSDTETRYLQLSEDVQQRILTAHSITSPLLFGIKTRGQLGGATELEQANEIFTENYVIPRLSEFIKFVNQVFIGFQISIKQEVNKVEQSRKVMSENEVLEVFSQFGIHKSKVKTIVTNLEFDENVDITKYISQESPKLTYQQDKALSMLIAGESLTTIANKLNVNSEELLDILRQLQRLKALDNDYKPTKSAKRLISSEVMVTTYEYAVRPELGEPIIETTRPFCRKMIEMGKVYLRKDIDEISRRLGRDIWHYRGGWYHNPENGVNYPHCRHYWVQNISIIDKSLL